MSKILRLKYFSIVFILLTWLAPVIASDDIKDEVNKTPTKPKQEITYKLNSPFTKSPNLKFELALDKPLELESSHLEKSRLNSENVRLQSTIDSLVRIITDERFIRPAFAHLFRAIVAQPNDPSIDNHTIGNLLRRVDLVRNPRILEFPTEFNKQIRQSVATSSQYLMAQELVPQIVTDSNLPSINYVSFRPFPIINNQEVTDIIDSLRRLSVRNDPEDQIISRRSTLGQLVSKSLQKPSIDLEREVDLGALPKLVVHEYQNYFGRPGIYEWYMIGSAIPDGDCFFHAIFTRNGQTETVVKQEASQIRTRVVEETQREEDSQRTIRLEMLGYYRDMMYQKKFGLVPQNIKTMLKQNDHHVIFRNALLEREEELDEEYINPVRHNDDSILEAISLENIQQYMTKYLNPENDEYYIEVPVGRNYPAGISELIARKSNIRVNYFALNRERAALNYIGTLGNGDNPIHSVLIEDNHFYPLYNEQEGEDKGNHFVQSINNFVEFMHNAYSVKQEK